MKLVQLLKLCIFVAFIATIITGTLFMMRSSEDGRKQMKAHLDVHDDKARFPEEARLSRHDSDEEEKEEAEVVRSHPKDVRIIPLPPSTAEATTESTATIAPKLLKELKESASATPPSIHIFYYPWYGNPEYNEKYYHWNHRYLSDWNPTAVGKTYPKGRHSPPGDIASVFYPSLGTYSSWSDKVIERHMKWISSAGIDVVAMSWYPKDKADPEGTPWDSLLPVLLNATEKAKMKLAFHLEPYEGRTAASVREDIGYILDEYGRHSAFYRTKRKARKGEKESGAKELPLFYIYDSYRVPPAEWAEIAARDGMHTIRGTELDSLLVGLYVDKGDEEKLVEAGFDGMYTYFAADGFSHGSSMSNWPDLSAFCAKNGLLFIPSVGPGYNDTRVRPWNGVNARDRKNGEYYREHFKMAHTSKADIVSITSFNEWHEGTQIEPAIPFVDKNGTEFQYATYQGGPEQYLQITLEAVNTYFTAHHENIPAQIARVV